MSSEEDKANQIRGYKATLSNPNVPDEAKENARQMLNELGEPDFDYRSAQPDEHRKNPGNGTGGLKAAINNSEVSEEAKRTAEEELKSM